MSNEAHQARAAVPEDETNRDQILEDAITFIEWLTDVPLLCGVEDAVMDLEDVQAHAGIEAASLRKRLADRASAQLEVEEALRDQSRPHPNARAICEALGFDPTNHHNAAKCPYCTLRALPANPTRSDEERAIRDVLAERQRQVGVKGWTSDHDDIHGDGQLALAAVCYALPDWQRERIKTYTVIGEKNLVERLWPWGWNWWKPKDVRHDLVRAAALLIAEIERFDRAAKRAGGAG